MRIGLVGPELWLRETVKRIAHDFPDISFSVVPYTNLIDLPSKLEGEQHACDVFLFLGETARRWTAKHLKPAVPWYGVPRSSSAFLRILARASMDGYPPRFITDFQNPEFFRQALDEAGITAKDSYISYISYGTFTAEGYMEKNAELMMAEYKKGKAAFCATIFIVTYEILKKNHIPVYYMLPSFEDVRHVVQEVVTHSKLEQKEEQTATIAISFDAPKPEELTEERAYKFAKAKLTASQLLFDFAYEIKAAVFPEGKDTFFLISTSRLLQAITHQFTRFDLLRTVKEKAGLTLSVGFSIGPMASETKLHAEKAMKYAMYNGGNCAFFLGEKNSLIGPIQYGDAAPVKESRDYLLLLAQRASINFEYLKIMSDLCEKEHRTTFTPAELADASGIRKRTMNRILLKLMDIGCCTEVGRNSPKQRGRPSRIIELHFEQAPYIKKEKP